MPTRRQILTGSLAAYGLAFSARANSQTSGPNILYLRDFGAKGFKLGQNTNIQDTKIDDTEAFQAALDMAAKSKSILRGTPGHAYYVSRLFVRNGIAAIDMADCTLISTNATNPSRLKEAVLNLLGPNTGALIGVTQASIAIKIDMSAGDRTAIHADQASYCTFAYNNIFGFTDDPDHNHRGIRLDAGSHHNRFHNNKITGAYRPKKRGMLIDLWGTGVPFGGFFHGDIKPSVDVAHNNIFYKNILTDGSYAFNIHHAEHTLMQDNVCTNQNHRAVYIANSSRFNHVTGNTLSEYGSSAVLLGYGASLNWIQSNICINTPGYGRGAEAAINIITGAQNNTIKGNFINSPQNYGIYIATDSSGNVIDGNDIQNSYRAHIAVENDFMDTPPVEALFSRPNYGDPTISPTPVKSWTYTGLTHTIIINNILHQGYAGRNIAAIYIAQIENDFEGAIKTSLTDVTLQNNTLTTPQNIGFGLYLYETTKGRLRGIKINNNNWGTDKTAHAFFAAKGTASFEDCLTQDSFF